MSLSSIIIATTAEKSRAEKLKQAILSCQQQSNCLVTIVVVVNGDKYCQELIDWLKSNIHVNFYYQPEGNLPKALAFGRSVVETKYFGFLDDDDELLNDSVNSRETILETNYKVDVVINNGFRQLEGKKTEFLRSDFTSNSTQTLLNRLISPNGNWLASCNGLYRTSTISTVFFADYAKYAEWTYFAFKLALHFNIAVCPTPGFIIHSTPGSLSKSFNYCEGIYYANLKILQLPLNKYVRKRVKERVAEAAHDISSKALEDGKLAPAIKFHLISLFSPKGFFKYFFYTRKLVAKIITS